MILSCDSFCPFFSKCPEIEELHFRFRFCFKIDHVHCFRNARFSYHIRLALFLKRPTESEIRFDWRSEEQGFVIGAFFYGYVLTQVVGGNMEDRYSPVLLFGIGVDGTAV